MMAILGGSSVTTLEGVLPFLIFSSGITWLPITLIDAEFGREREVAGPLSLLPSDRTTSFPESKNSRPYSEKLRSGSAVCLGRKNPQQLPTTRAVLL